MEEHQEKVAAIAAKVRSFGEQGVKYRISHGSTNSTRPSATRRDHNVLDLSSLCRVLKVDREALTAWVEPNVAMDGLVEETLKHGLIPLVVMEFPGITVGGGYAGTCGESSSFKHGFFDRTLNWVEMILASGEVVRCSRTERADLFHGAAGAAGSLGTTTLVEIRLRAAKRFVETTYHPVASAAEAVAKCKALIHDASLEYVDGILFSPTHGAVVAGRPTDTPAAGAPTQCFSAAEDPWFYLHVEERTRQHAAGGEAVTEAIPLAEYLFRYDRGGFWVGRQAFDYFGCPFTAATRRWFDDILHTRMLYLALHASGQSRRYIVQDVALPFAAAEAFIAHVGGGVDDDHDHDDKHDDDERPLGIWPLWLCPVKQSPPPTLHPHNHSAAALEADGQTLQPLLNVGVWGVGPAEHGAFVRANRALERKARALGGMKWLYAHAYYAEDEFWADFDAAWYEGLRDRYGAKGLLPSLYEKVRVDVAAPEERAWAAASWWVERARATWPVGGVWALVAAIHSGQHRRAREATWKWPR
ncbi:fad binding domain-containing protein [Diplodia corticola]|uniref:Delta(24)-sterol reductase n=1 Tax=Diplodia corticola TaxID=236234 RepID=A0A1J9RJY6_9PEZI|nr:fad binding domain-containing protein [Diplodia corticola]OJD32883.1 fad binding domain-containing protein [Diplodia corticola]